MAQLTPASAAEDAMALNPLRASATRVERPDAVFTDQGPDPMLRTVARLRVADSRAVDALMDNARAWFGQRGGHRLHLVARAVDDSNRCGQRDSIRFRARVHTIAATAMVLDHDPSIMRTGIEIREVSDYDDFAAGATHRGPSRGPPRERS